MLQKKWGMQLGSGKKSEFKECGFKSIVFGTEVAK
jgi:hypothetical protein